MTTIKEALEEEVRAIRNRLNLWKELACDGETDPMGTMIKDIERLLSIKAPALADIEGAGKETSARWELAMVKAALKLVIEQKAPAYHDCIDAGEPECAWCIARNLLAGKESEGGGCYDCGRPYSKGPDLVVSDEDWVKIAPKPNGGGVLCPNCMNDRFEALGIKGVVATFTSGPFSTGT